MRLIFAISLVFGLAACQQNKPIGEMSYTEIKQLAAVINQRCTDQGVKQGTPEWGLCTKQEIARESSTRNRRAAAIAAAGRSSSTVCNTIGYTTICN